MMGTFRRKGPCSLQTSPMWRCSLCRRRPFSMRRTNLDGSERAWHPGRDEMGWRDEYMMTVEDLSFSLAHAHSPALGTLES